MKLNELVSFTKLSKTDKTPLQEDPNLENEEEKEDDHVGRGTKVKIVAALVVVGFAVYVAWWVQEPGSVRAAEEMGGTTETAMAGEKTVEVSFVDFALEPAEITVDKGTTVVWTNKDTVPHTVTGPIFTSGTLDRGQSYSFTFSEDGTYDYHCSFHPQITGKVIVGTGGLTETQTGDNMVLASTEELPPGLAEDLMPAAAEDMSLEAVPTEEIILPEFISAGEAESGLPGESLTASAPETESTITSGEEIMVHASAVEKNKKISSSGPEDFLYAGAFMAILFLNRRKLISALR